MAELTSRDRRALMVLGGIGVLALLLFIFVIGKGGGGEPQQAAPVPPQASGSPATVPSPRTTSPPVTPIFGGRDPFQPLITTGEAGGGGGPSPTTEPTGPVTSPSPTMSPSPAGGTTGGGTRISHQGHTVTLDDIFTKDGKKMAQVEVDGKVYTVQVGESFGHGFTLESIKDDCATFTHGDSRFTLCLHPQK